MTLAGGLNLDRLAELASPAGAAERDVAVDTEAVPTAAPDGIRYGTRGDPRVLLHVERHRADRALRRVGPGCALTRAAGRERQEQRRQHPAKLDDLVLRPAYLLARLREKLRERLREVPWPQALAHAAERLKPYVGDGFALLCDTSSTLEDRHVFRRFTYEVMQSPHYVEIQPDEHGISHHALPDGVRAALLTGMSPWKHGMLGYGQVAERYATEMPRALRKAGYYTFGIGKMHWYPQRNLHGFHRTILDEVLQIRPELIEHQLTFFVVAVIDFNQVHFLIDYIHVGRRPGGDQTNGHGCCDGCHGSPP